MLHLQALKYGVICYINDLPNVLRHCEPHIYADETAIIAKGNDPVDISHSLNVDANNLDDWFKCNRLSCNVGKTKCMMFSNSRYRRKDIPLAVHLDNQTIEEVSYFKYLGLNLDKHLNFEYHADKIAGKVRPCTSALW